ncbi:major facilitator superfamily transporter [Saccharata proteae CBS 121410]|uniref:Major facilitator superfamily transporter n=1 Tax=Saccharata proteae CBS 121410 TaxID=1314787 RepID=A0A9P4HUA1_9PEZI|nr:major facilitator superfamily transporter [Saccharata proteae CBS 121410]
MQSVLQFRRIGLAAQKQVERDVEKANLITAPQPSSQQEKLHEPQPRTARPVERTATANTARTQYTARAALGHTLTGVHARDRLTHEGKGDQVFVVGWEGELDPNNPRNYSLAKRIGIIFQISAVTFAVCAASSIDAAVLPQAAAEFGVSEVVETLATGMYLAGFGAGSLIAGPFSETFGRNLVYMGTIVIFMIWIMAAALSPNIGAQIVFRFIAGCSASTPLVCAGGSISDMFNSMEKTWAFPMFAVSGFGGPILGPVVGAYIGPSPHISWRWSEWIMMITGGLVLVLVLLCMPETYGPVLLSWKAKHLRRITGDDRFRAQHEIVDSTLLSRLKISMTRPFLMATEPIIILMTLYLTVIYIILFTFLDGYDFIFRDTYGISQGLSNTIFVAMFIGVLSAFALVPLVWRITKRALEAAHAKGEAMFNPEIRLWYVMCGGAFAIPISLFWMGWTDYASISIWSPILASVLFGYGIICVFISAYMYIIDSYEMYSASALTFTALTRYLAAGGMTVAGIPFYRNMGTHYTCTILACISIVLIPVPYVFYKYGYWVRKKSKYAVSREI